ncbi:sensor histidine kinase [Sagittula sp. S175]|uniref:sensor histidine kinase n=1 Tax=Sagittula sp. S175 TaxID=3415129 RepID=UPI003C7C87FC
MMTLDSVELAFGVTPIAMLLADSAGTIRLTNTEFDHLFGYGNGALSGQPIEVLLPEGFRAEHVSLRAAYAVLPAKRRMGAGRNVAGITASGEVLPLELALEPVTVNGAPMTIVTALDARAGMQNRERIRAIMDAASCTMLVVDDEGRIEFVNRAVTDLLGYTTQELMGQPVEMLIAPDLRRAHQVYRRSYASLGDSRAMARGRTITAQHRDGHAVAVEVALNRLDLDGAPRVVATLVDLSERIEAEQAMAARALELERLNADLSHFNRGVSHDLKAPLSSIAGLVSLCIEDLDAGDMDEVRDNLLRTQEIAERSVVDIEDLLRMSLAPEREIVWEETDVAAMVDQLWADIGTGVPGATITIALAGIGRFVTEPPALRGILRNLLSNAVKYRDHGKAGLAVQVSGALDGGGLRLEVSDNGIGIPADFLPDVFGLFKQLGDRGGSGIGLNLVKRNIERLSGEITVFSTLGEGTRFVVSLPGHQEQQE